MYYIQTHTDMHVELNIYPIYNNDMPVASFYLFIFLRHIPLEVMSGFIYSTGQSAKALLFKSEYLPRDVARFVITFNFQYYSDELKVTSHDQKGDVVRC